MRIEEVAGDSKSLQRLRNRLSMTKAHTMVVNKALVETAARKTPAGKPSRHRSVTNHAIRRNAELAIQLLYPHFTEYIRSLLKEMYRVRPLDVVGKAQANIRFDEVVHLGSYEAICEHMIDQVFRSLENQRNTKKLLSKILDKTGVDISQQVLQDAMMYLEMRHLIVHNSSLIDEAFEQRYGSLLNVKAGRKLKIDIGTAKKALKAVEELCIQVDRGLVAGGYVYAA